MFSSSLSLIISCQKTGQGAWIHMHAFIPCLMKVYQWLFAARPETEPPTTEAISLPLPH